MYNKVQNRIYCIKDNLIQKVAEFVQNERGDFMETAIKILIAVVIGALVLGGLYALWANTVMPSTENSVKDMFNYSGS